MIPLASPGRFSLRLAVAVICVLLFASTPVTPPREEPPQFSFQWIYIEYGAGMMGFTMDDMVWEWDESHPADQAPSSSCAGFRLRPDEPGSCEAGSTPLQFSFQWMYVEGGEPGAGFTMDDMVWEWDESHPGNQAFASSCAALPLRPDRPGVCQGGSLSGAACVTGRAGDCPGGFCLGLGRQCATVSLDRMFLHSCDTSVRVTVQDATAGSDPGAVETVEVNIRSDAEPFGEAFVLEETAPDSGVFRGFVAVSSQLDSPGVILLDPSSEGSVVVSYRDPDCDLDGPGREPGGVGQLGEDDFTDVDGDGTLNLGADGLLGSRIDPEFDDDNCFDAATGTDVANPGQEDSDTFCIDESGATDGTYCSTDTDCLEGAGLGFTACRGDRFGDACDNCPFDHNTDQADDDGDGIGNVCELDYDPVIGHEDLDGDGVFNSADNCPSTPNLNQNDSDGNYVGDACDGDGDRDGDGVLDGADNCPDVLNPDQLDADGDGIGDGCDGLVEDWDFDGVLNALDSCPTVANPADVLGIQADVDGDGLGDPCDPDSDDDDGDGNPDDLLQFFAPVRCQRGRSEEGSLVVVAVEVLDAEGDGDGILDPGETAHLVVTLRNQATDEVGTPIPLRDVKVALDFEDPSMGCTLDGTAFYGDIEPGEDVTNPANDRFQVRVIRAESTLRLDLDQLKLLPLRLTADTANARLAGQLSLLLGLDILGDPTGGGPLDGTGEMFEDFEGLPGTAGLTRTLGRQETALSDVIPVVPGTNCSHTPIGPADCSVNTSVNDWHLHDPYAEPNNAPEGGKAYSGSASLHMGRHLNPSNPRNSTYRFRQLTAFTSPPLNVRLHGESSVEWWHIVRLADDNSIGFITGEAGDVASAQLRLDEEPDPGIDSWGPWFRLQPEINSYDHRRDRGFNGACKFDPTDDFFDASEGGVADETTCYPQWIWSDQGNPTGNGAPTTPGGMCIDGDSNGHNDCGGATTTGPGFTETGNLGNGVWVKTRVNLSPFAGRRAQVRWLFSSLAFFGDRSILSYNETPGQPGAFDINEFDDGWYIDDIRFRGLLENPLEMVLDGGDDVPSGGYVLCGPNRIAETHAEGDDVQILLAGTPCNGPEDMVVAPGPDGVNDSLFDAACPSDPAEFCDEATARINLRPGCEGASDGWFCASDADCGIPGTCNTSTTFAVSTPGRGFLLDASSSFLDRCVGGMVHHRFVECASPEPGDACDAPGSGTLLQAFSNDATLWASPPVSTRYRVGVRCSSQPAGTGCLDEIDAVVLVYPSGAGGFLHMTASCALDTAGSPDKCDAGDPLVLDFVQPQQGEGVDGLAFYRVAADGLGSPVLEGGVCVAAGLAVGAATGEPVTLVEPVPFTPAAGKIAFYLLGHDAGGPEHPAGQARVERHLAPRFVRADCP
jgi:hypothetical protein